jgi:hypothetical protein
MNELNEILKKEKDLKKVLWKSRYYKQNSKLEMEIINALMKCDFNNLKINENNDIECLEENLLETEEFDKFRETMINDIELLSADELANIFEFDKRIMEKGYNKFIFFLSHRRFDDDYDESLELNNIKRDVLKKAIEIYGIKKFKKLMLKINKIENNIYLIKFYMNEFNDFSKNIVKIVYNYYVNNTGSVLEFLRQNLVCECFKEAYEYGFVKNKDIKIIIEKLTMLDADDIESVFKKGKNLKGIRDFIEIVCNDYNYENYWNDIKETIGNYIDISSYYCFDVTDLFEI